MREPSIPTVREIMIRSVVSLRPDMAASDAAKLLVKHQISGAPVLDPEGRLVGMLSEFDLLRVAAVAGYEMLAHAAQETVAELMSTSVTTVSPDLDLFGLAHEFMRLRMRRFPVLENERLIGQVSRRAALQAVLELCESRAATATRYPDYPSERTPMPDYPRR